MWARRALNRPKRRLPARAVKPANLLYDDDDQLFLSDFGLSALAEVTMPTQSTLAGGAGTPAYMAVEQHDPEEFGRPGAKADLWAFGGVMLAMLTGKPPWAGMRQNQVITQVVVKRKAPPIPAGLPPLVVALLERCFAHEPAQRIGAAEALDLLAAIPGAPAGPEPEPPLREMPVEVVQIQFAVKPMADREHEIFRAGGLPAGASERPQRSPPYIGFVLQLHGVFAWACAHGA